MLLHMNMGQIYLYHIRTTFYNFFEKLLSYKQGERSALPELFDISILWITYLYTWYLLTSLFRGKIIKGKDHWLFHVIQALFFCFLFVQKVHSTHISICTFRKVQKYASYYWELNKSRSTKSSMGKVHWKLFQKNQKDSSFHLKSCKRQVINK